jgi:PAS domain-containing protein
VFTEVNAVPIINDSGQLEFVAVTFIDVTERRRVEHKLTENEEFLRVVLDTSPDATIRTGIDGRIEYVNNRAERSLKLLNSPYAAP